MKLIKRTARIRFINVVFCAKILIIKETHRQERIALCLFNDGHGHNRYIE